MKPLKQIIRQFFPNAKRFSKPKSFPHSEIIRFENNGKKLIAKALEKETLAQTAPEQKEKLLAYLYNTVSNYYSALKKIGIPVPMYHKLVLADGQLVEFADDIGKHTIRTLLATAPPPKAKELITLILKSILPILKQKKSMMGFDPDGDNFLIETRRGKRTAVFIDFSPARLKYQEEYLVGFHQPTRKSEREKSFERYYTNWGIMRRMRIHILNAHPALDGIFFEVLREVLPNTMFRDLEKRFNATGGMRTKHFLESGKMTKIVEMIQNERDVDTLREMAFQVFWIKKKQRLPGAVYDLSRIHFHLSKETRIKRLETFKKALIQLL